MFRRPTSCRPCLMSSIALSYRILSGCELLSALVDLLTFFFLWKICALLAVAPSKNSAPRMQSARDFPGKYGLEVAPFTVRPKLHLSCESQDLRGNSRLNLLDDSVPSPDFARRTSNYTLNQRSGGAGSLPFRAGPGYPTLPSVMHGFVPEGCLATLPALQLFSTKCNNLPSHHGYYTSFTLPRSRGPPPNQLNGQTQIPLRLALRSHRRHRLASSEGRARRPLLHRSRKRARHRRRLRSQIEGLGARRKVGRHRGFRRHTGSGRQSPRASRGRQAGD